MDKHAVEQEVERRFLTVVGTVVETCELTGYIGETHQQGEFFADVSNPFRVRVLPTNRESLFHWTDNEHCDPYWDVEIVEPRSDLPIVGIRSVWMFGSSPTD